VQIRGALVQIGPHAIDRAAWDWRATEENPFWCPDAAAALFWADYLDGVRKAGSSAGAIIEVVASGVPAGLGEPVYDKLDGDLARALMTINAVKGVEIGAGFAAATLRGEDNADEMRIEDGRIVFLSNKAGGILGGISTGQDIVARFAVKPTSSILQPMRTVDVDGNEVEIETHGRHDPCVGIRAVPVGEAMVACVLADHLLRHRAIGGKV
jgi:chorismate synthase